MWMFYSRKPKLKLKNIHNWTLRVVLTENERNYKDLVMDSDESSMVFMRSIYSF